MCNAWNHSDGCECGFGPPYEGSVADFFDGHLAKFEGKNLRLAGPAAMRLGALVNDDRLTTQLASTFLLQSYSGSRLSKWMLHRSKATKIEKASTIYVVRHGKGWPRHDLLVYDPQIPENEVVQGLVDASPDELRRGWPRFHTEYLGQSSMPKWLKGLDTSDVPEIAIEAMRAQQHFFISMHPPRIVWTQALPAPLVSSPAIAVSTHSNKGIVSTAGVSAMDKNGRRGVTTALHALKDSTDPFVKGMPGVVCASDLMSDSCFIEVTDPTFPHSQPCLGPLSGVTPRGSENVWFDGVTSGRVATYVQAWTAELPLCVPMVQSRVLTPPVTQTGDSGAALMTERGEILGFAQYRTPFNARCAHSGWMWAESVFKALKLQ